MSNDIPLPPHEPEDEYFRIVDPLTHGIIYCVPRSHDFTLADTRGCPPPSLATWLERNIPHASVHSLIDICHTKPPYNPESFAAYDGSRVPPERERACVLLLADYACMVHSYLKRHGCCCLIGENFLLSKCSMILFIFLLMRGMVQKNILAWLTDSFQAQLPTIATYQRTMHQVSYPDFHRYENVVSSLRKLLLLLFYCGNM
jgi:hypothetical protein